jgi:hypothetical protein
VGGGSVLHPKAAYDREAVDARQVRRDQDQRRAIRPRDTQSLGAIAQGDGLITRLSEGITQSALNYRVGIDD